MFETITEEAKRREGVKTQAARKAGLTSSEKTMQSPAGEKNRQ